MIEGIYWCIDHDINVINMSFGTKYYSAALEKAINDAVETGIILVAAAGNCGADAGTIDYPAAFEHVIAVGASDGDNKITGFTSKGEELDILAPGEKVWSNGVLQGMVALDGTSIAAAHVTGAVALILEKHPNADINFVKQLLVASSAITNDEVDVGILNIENSLHMSDEFVTVENEEIVEPCPIELDTYDTSHIVSGSWAGKKHKEMVGNANELRYIALAAGKTDDYYGVGMPPYACGALHAHHNYVAALHFLYKLARGDVKNFNLGTTAGITAFLNDKKTVLYTSDKTYGDKDFEKMRNIIIDACSLPNGMAAQEGISGNKNLKYMIFGIAVHLLGDTFAHRTMVPKTADSTIFNKSDFKDWANFEARVSDSVIECRDISSYLKNDAGGYADRISFYSDRYTAAQSGVSNMISYYLQDKGLNIKKFFTSNFSKKLNNFQAYSLSAGYLDDVSAFSTGKYRVDGSNDRDHVDYPSYIYK